MDEEKTTSNDLMKGALNKFGKVLVKCLSRDVIDVKLEVGIDLYQNSIPKVHKRLRPFIRLILYIYTKGAKEAPPIHKTYSTCIYLYQRLTRDSVHS
jgi:hypothetical protein